MKELSTHARAAKMMKQELKKAFPSIKFSIRSASFSGWNSVHVEWLDGPIYDAVNAIVDKYQEGHFDGMQDMYEISNRRHDIPQVKYVQVRREVSETIKEQVFKHLQETHSYFDKVISIDETHPDLMEHWRVWTARQYIHRVTSKMDLTSGYRV